MAWTGFDLDGTLARWGTLPGDNCDVGAIGDPILGMVAILKGLLAQGYDVRIMTARVGPASLVECQAAGYRNLTDCVAAQRELIEAWCRTHLGVILPITATKDFHMERLYDDRAIQVIPNRGQTLGEYYEGRLETYRRALEARGDGNE